MERKFNCLAVYTSSDCSDTMNYPQKNRFQSVPIADLCLYNIQRENLVLKNSLCSRQNDAH